MSDIEEIFQPILRSYKSGKYFIIRLQTEMPVTIIKKNPLSFFDPAYAALYADVTVFESSKLKSASLEINSAHHYEDAAGKWVDIDLLTTWMSMRDSLDR